MKSRILVQFFITHTFCCQVLKADVSQMISDRYEWFVNILEDKIPPLSSHEDQEILEEVMMDTVQISKKYGYVAEYHNISTRDGLILEVYRIPHGKKSRRKGNPILIFHGIAATSEYFVSNGKNSIVFYLADNGYDVWLGNCRGTPKSWSKKYTRRQEEFWDYSWEDIADFDIPDTVDYILKKSGKKKLVLMGHSMGNSAGIAFLAAHKNYHKKIAGFVAFSPVVGFYYNPSFLRQIAPFVNIIRAVVKLFSIQHTLVFPKKSLILGQHLCPVKQTFICGYTMDLLNGYNPYLRNNSRNYLYVTRASTPSSLKSIVHYSQVYDKRAMYRFDYGLMKNLIKYRSTHPPIYDIKQIKVPVALIYGANDIVTNAIDIALFARDLPNLIDLKVINFTMFNHADFGYAVNAVELYYKDLLNYVKKMFKASQQINLFNFW